MPPNQEAFDALYQDRRGDYLNASADFAKLVFDLLSKYHQVMKKLKGKMDLALAMPMTDLKQQLAHLVYDKFLQLTPLEQLKSYPRYLEGCIVRHEKMARDMANERRYIPLLHGWWEQYQARKKQLEAQGLVCENLSHFRWLIEEQRVSWYAQQLGTRETVSEKRLNKVWESVRR